MKLMYIVNEHEKNIELPDKITVKRSYYVILLSNKENLNLCIKHNLAGFPDTNNGIWTFSDILIGDYISFFFDGELIYLYEVTDKIELNENKKEFVKSRAYLKDPIPLNNSDDKWHAIIRKKDKQPANIYFPYRLKLRKISEARKKIFDPKFLQLGYNLLPRMTYGKTHFQLPMANCCEIFGLNKQELKQYISVSSEEYFMNFKFSKEFILQILLKRLLNVLLTHDNELQKLFKIRDIEDMEILSEQKVQNGEADLVIDTSNNNVVFIEVKNKSILKKKSREAKNILNKNDLNSEGRKAFDQVLKYESITENQKVLHRAIAGALEDERPDMIIKEVEDNNHTIIAIEVRKNKE